MRALVVPRGAAFCVAALALALALAGAARAAGAPFWSAPEQLDGCTDMGKPTILFPSEGPASASGPGAIVWSGARDCPGGTGARVAALGAGDLPGVSRLPRTAEGKVLPEHGSLLAAAAPRGRIVIAATGALASRSSLIEGTAGGTFEALTPPGSIRVVAAGNAYLGDLSLLASTVLAKGRRLLSTRVQPHLAFDFAPSRAGTTTAGAVSTGTIALDFRTDALAVWARAGSIYARDEPLSGTSRQVQRLAAGSPGHISALISDDNRAIVAWSETQASLTSVYLDRSTTGVRFGAPMLVERFHDPDGLDAPATSPTLIRLSSESVMIAWAGSDAGHWVVRTAAIGAKLGTPSTIAATGADAMLAALASGPSSDAVVMWTVPRPPVPPGDGAGEAQIFAARGFDAFPERTIFSAPEPVAGFGAVADPTLAIDPATDTAVAVWSAERGRLRYAIRRGEATP